VLGYDNNPKVNQMALQILTLSLVDEKLLNYRASQIAASAVILAVNIFMVQKELKEGTVDPANSFFAPQLLKSDKRILNTNIWNNITVSQQSGYTIEMLKPCLYELSRFIEEYLEPNKLKYFDIEAIHTVQDCSFEGQSVREADVSATIELTQ
jgi:hypothetical protein